MTVGDFKKFCAEMDIADDTPLMGYHYRIGGPADYKRAILARFKDEPTGKPILVFNTMGEHFTDEFLAEIDRLGTVGSDGNIHKP